MSRQHFKREISNKLTKAQAQGIIAQWDGKESSRDFILQKLTEWQPVKTICTIKTIRTVKF